MAYYNTNFDVTSLVDIGTVSNQVTGDYFGLSLVLLVWFVAWAGIRQSSLSENAFTAATFGSAVFSVILYGAGWLSNFNIISGLAFLTIISAIISRRVNP